MPRGKGKGTAATAKVEDEEVHIASRTYRHKVSLSSTSNVSIRGLDVTYGGTELLQSAHLKLVHGHHYGLVGPNGVGKSTLLRYIASGKIPNFPTGLRVFHMEQNIALDTSLTVTEVVLQSSATREQLQQRLDVLENEGPIEEEEEGDAEATALEISDLYETLDELDSGDAEARVASILAGLQFTPTMQKKTLAELSGGWRMRTILACALFNKPDLLLLDEPTNHLDIHAVVWLEEYIKQFKNTVVVVSHDREFLNNVATDIIHFANKALKYYPGDFRSFKRAQQEKILNQQRRQDKEEGERKRILESIERFKQNAKGNNQQSMGMVRSRKIALSKLGGPQLIDGGWWKLFDMGWAWGAEGVVVTPEQVDPEYRFKFPTPPPLPTKNSLLQLNNVSFTYPGMAKNVISNVTMDIGIDSRIAILGKNGAGKTTLVELMTGKLQPTATNTPQPSTTATNSKQPKKGEKGKQAGKGGSTAQVTSMSEGEVYRHHNMSIAHFSQHHAEQLDLSLTPLQYLAKLFPGVPEQTLRGRLGSYGLGGNPATRTIGTLSGGQKSRLTLSIITWNDPHILILDEPTNHLDHESIDALIISLQAFEGAIVLVSHDRHLVDSVADELWEVAGGKVKKFEGTMEDFQSSLRK